MFGLLNPVLLGHPELVVPLGVKEASNDASLAFAWTQDFDEVVFRFKNVVPANNDDEFIGLTSSNGGSSFDSGAADYLTIVVAVQTGLATDYAASAPHLRLAGEGGVNQGISNTTARGFSGELRIVRPFDTSKYTRMYSTGGLADAGVTAFLSWCYGARKAAARVDGVEFSFLSTGNIAEGSIEGWGILPVERAA